jgi:hypothetical protein
MFQGCLLCFQVIFGNIHFDIFFLFADDLIKENDSKHIFSESKPKVEFLKEKK